MSKTLRRELERIDGVGPVANNVPAYIVVIVVSAADDAAAAGRRA